MIYAEEEKVDIIRDSNQFYKSSIDQELPMLSEDSEDEDEDEEHNNNYNEYDIFAGDRYPKKKKEIEDHIISFIIIMLLMIQRMNILQIIVIIKR
jgi:hypothetical protein